jgi:hypothetical protein
MKREMRALQFEFKRAVRDLEATYASRAGRLEKNIGEALNVLKVNK